MFRLYIQQLNPGIRIYRSPLNIDPVDAALPVSAPASYGRDLAQRIGSYYTQGIEEDTAALRQGVFNLPEYLEQSRLVSEEHTALLKDALDHFHDGFLFFYFSEIDQNSHMLWGRHDDELLKTYQIVDSNIGMVLDRAPAATVIVMSDHGFAAFNRGVNLNTWLLQEGFLALNHPDRDATFASIDWKRTKAYAMGLNALYINLAGRDEHGIVAPGVERDGLVADLARRLKDLPRSGYRTARSRRRDNRRKIRQSFCARSDCGICAGLPCVVGNGAGRNPRRCDPRKHRCLDRRSLHLRSCRSGRAARHPYPARGGSSIEGPDGDDSERVWHGT